MKRTLFFLTLWTSLLGSAADKLGVPTGWSTPAGLPVTWVARGVWSCGERAGFSFGYGDGIGPAGPGIDEDREHVDLFFHVPYPDRPRQLRADEEGRIFLRESARSPELWFGTVDLSAGQKECALDRERADWVPGRSLTASRAPVRLAPGIRVALARWVHSSWCWPKFAVGTISRNAEYRVTIADASGRVARFGPSSEKFFASGDQCRAWTEKWRPVKKELFPSWVPF